MPPSDTLTPGDWHARLCHALRTPLPAGYAAPSENRPASEHGIAARRAGVLIPVVGADEPYVYFTQRSAALRHHPGQISFPGGSVETHDADARAAALREAHEEIDLDPTHVEILGELPEYRTVTGFVVSPFVGWVNPAATVAPDDAEVARLFAVPLAHIVDVDNFHQYCIERNGRNYEVQAIDYGDDHIWGATAGMLLGLVQRLAHAENRPLKAPRMTCNAR
ncbi:NTP pyrophosphohydrolase [Salinisphaera dokdonensis CL-ES53]|uniref:NTP pyrophosphohydrolase n=1 Tax=Salinisphaera dokdonensis CL-ES53 TaxID=1304272 RepID=A0ABV2AVT2_9GAMM